MIEFTTAAVDQRSRDMRSTDGSVRGSVEHLLTVDPHPGLYEQVHDGQAAGLPIGPQPRLFGDDGSVGGVEQVAEQMNAFEAARLDHSTCVENSAPGTSVRPGGRWLVASAQPPVVSWSVMATTSSPASAAFCMSSAGESVPSEHAV